MSGQGQPKGGQNSYQNPYGQQGMITPDSYGGGGYFSMGNSTRMRGMGSPLMNGPGGLTGGGVGGGMNGGGLIGGSGGLGGGPTGNTPLGAPMTPGGSPFGNVGGGAFTMPGQPQGQTGFPTNPGNVDPNSPEYAAYYNSLPASTRLFLAPPGSAQANFKYNDYNSSLANPNQAHF